MCVTQAHKAKKANSQINDTEHPIKQNTQLNRENNRLMSLLQSNKKALDRGKGLGLGLGLGGRLAKQFTMAI